MVEDFFDATAAFYDAVYDADQEGDRAFYRDLAVEADGPVLEVGCGTGRIYLELLRAGVDADGIDLSAAMLDVLREKAAEEGLEPNVWRADVTEFEPDREYALVLIPFRTFLHLTDLDDQLAALRRIREALAPGGRLALNFFVPDFEVICETYGEWQEESFEHDDEQHTMRTYVEVVDDVAQVTRERREVYDADGDLVTEGTYELTLLGRREFELLVRAAGFSGWTVYGGFDRDPLASADQEMVWLVER